MTEREKAKEQAKELVNKFWCIGESDGDTILNWEESKQCATICVDEIIKVLYKINHIDAENQNSELLKAKQEIENL